MYKDVYIGLAHDKAFDFDKEGNWNGYMPTLLYGKNVPYEYLEGGNVIYWTWWTIRCVSNLIGAVGV